MNRTAKTAAGVAVSVFFLWWALHDVSLAEVVHEIRTADPLLFFLSAIAAGLGIPIRAVRWRVLLAGVGAPVPFQPRMAATAMGFGANNVLPARIGEIVRAVSLRRLAGVSLGGAFSSLVLERVFDAIVLVGFLFAVMAMPSFPAAPDVAGLDPRAAARWVAAATAALGMVLFGMALAPARALGLARRAATVLPARLRTPLLGALGAFLGGLAVLRDWRLFVLSLLWAVAQWAFLAVSFLLGFRAFGIDVPYSGAVFLQSLTSLAVAVPSSPGFFGPFEAAAKVGLSLWAVPPARAVSFAIGFHLAGFVPVTALGLYYFWRVGFRLSEMEHAVEAATEPAPSLTTADAPRA